MTDDKLSFLDDQTADQNETTEVAQAAPEVTVETPEVVETKTEPVTEQPQPKGDGHSIPLPKYLETFNEAREARKRIAELEEAARSKAETPDSLLDPEGYAAHQEKVLNERIWDVTARTSEIAARRYYGEDVVKAAFEALQGQKDPLLGMHIRRSADPWDEIVRWHHQQQLLAEFGNDPAAYRQRVISEWQQQQAAAQAEQQQQPLVPTPPARTPIPPASLSKAPASKAKASDVPIGPGNAFDGAFAR